jgi:hypothetical protein
MKWYQRCRDLKSMKALILEFGLLFLIRYNWTHTTHTLTPQAHTCVRVCTHTKKRLGDSLASSARETSGTTERACVRVPYFFLEKIQKKASHWTALPRGQRPFRILEFGPNIKGGGQRALLLTGV